MVTVDVADRLALDVAVAARRLSREARLSPAAAPALPVLDAVWPLVTLPLDQGSLLGSGPGACQRRRAAYVVAGIIPCRTDVRARLGILRQQRHDGRRVALVVDVELD